MAVIVRKLRLIEGGASDVAGDRPDRQHPRLLVAIASQHGTRLDAHFGYARRLMVYEVTPQAHRLVQAIACEAEESDRPESEDRIGLKVAALAGCDLLFALAIGPPAAAKVIRANIHPIKIDAPERIESVIARVQSMMTGKPPSWIRKILGDSQHSMKGAKERLQP
jgi:nitrogen fixation protein NifX